MALTQAFRSRKRGRDCREGTPEGKAKPAVSVTPVTPPATAPPRVAAAPPPAFRDCVRVDPLVKRVYALIRERTFLDWGLTSDWAVDAPRRCRAAGAAPPAAAPPVRASEDGNAASEGYGEMTEGSIERLLLHLRALRAHAADAALPLTPAHELSAASGFIDVGSGYGKVVLHAALSGAGVAAACGVEYVPSRAAKAASVLADLLDERCGSTKAARAAAPPGLLAARLGRVALRAGDATAAGTLLPYSHVYMYDKVFADATASALARQLNDRAAAPRVLVTYRRPEAWRRLGLAPAWQLVSHVTMRTTGGQNFRAYILAR